MPLSSNQIEDAFALVSRINNPVLLHSNLTDEINAKIIISQINTLLSSHKTRLKGFENLSMILPSCSETILAENGLKWINYCHVQGGDDIFKEIKLITTAKLIDLLYTNQDFTKIFVQSHLYKIVENCSSSLMNVYEAEAILNCLQTCMKYYPSWFGQHKLRIENFLALQLQSSQDRIVEKAALAYHYLQQVGGAGPNGINYISSFSMHMVKLTATVNQLFDILFENAIEIDSPQQFDVEGYSFPPNVHDKEGIVETVTRRIKNCLKFISVMIRNHFPHVKEVFPIHLLGVIQRGVAMHSCLSEKNLSLQSYHYSLFLIQIQVELLQFLRLIVIWQRENLLPFSSDINKILLNCLRRCKSCNCFDYNSIYQETIYKTLDHWFIITKTAVPTAIQVPLLDSILCDISSENKQVILMLENVRTNKSAKAKQKGIHSKTLNMGENGLDPQNLPSTMKSNQESNCKFALGVLKQMLTYSVLKVSESMIPKVIVSLIWEIQSGKISHPYNNSDCKVLLYEVLTAFQEQHASVIVPPLSLSIILLNNGLRQSDRRVINACERGLATLEKICQPICPALSFVTIKSSESEKGLITEIKKSKKIILLSSETPRVIDKDLEYSEDGDEFSDKLQLSENSCSQENEFELISTAGSSDQRVKILDIRVVPQNGGDVRIDPALISPISIKSPNAFLKNASEDFELKSEDESEPAQKKIRIYDEELEADSDGFVDEVADI